MTRGAEGGAWVQGWGARAGRAARACGVPAAVPRGGDAAASDLQIKGGGARQGTIKGTAAGKATGLHLGQEGQGRLLEVGAPIDPELTADAEEGGDVGPLGAGVPARACTGKAPRARQHRAVGRLSAGAPRLHKSCRWRRPQSKGRSCLSGRARRDLRVRAVEGT